MRHTVLIDSRDREYDAYPDASTYRVMLPNVYKHVEKARLISAEIPASFYVFTASAGNTSLRLAIDDVTYTATIPDGNYGSSSMSSALATALTQATGVTFTVSISRTTRKLTISTADATEFALEASTGPPTGWGLPYYLGFERGVAYQSSDGVLVSPRLVSLNPYNYILVDIAELNGLDEGGMYGDRVGSGSFAKIPFDALSFDYVYVNTDNATFPEITLRPRIPTLDRLHISFRFHDGRPVDFRGVENSMMLELVTREPKEDTKALVHSVSSGVSYAVERAMTQASSKAASAAAKAATKAATKLALDSKPAEIQTIRWVPWALTGLLVLGIVWYLSQKRSV